MARVVFDSFEPNNACFESPAKVSKKIDECEVKVVFHAEGSAGYDPSIPPTVYFKRRGNTEFYLDSSPQSSVSVGLLKGLGFQENDPNIQSKIYYSIGLTHDLKTLYDNFLIKKQRPIKPFTDLVFKYKDFLITGTMNSQDPITKSKTVSFVESILSASDEALEFVDKLNQSFQDPNGNQSRLLPDMKPKIEWLFSLIRVQIELTGNLPAIKINSPDLFSRSEKWVKQIIVYLGTGAGDPQILFNELNKICDVYREQGNIPPEYRNFAEILKKALTPFHDIGNISRLPSIQQRWNQVVSQLMQEEMRYHLNNASQSGALQREVEKELKQAKLSKRWFEEKERIHEITEAVLTGMKAFVGNSKELLFTLDPSSMESAVKKMVARHGIQEREYIIGTLAALRFIKSQEWLGILREDETKLEAKIKFKITAEAEKNLEAYEQKLARKLSSSLTKTNIVLPLVEAGICLIGGVLAGTGGGFQNRPLTLTGSTITGFGCSALAVHFIPNRNPYLTDSLTALLGGGLGFTSAWFATQNMGNGMPPDMIPPSMMPDPNARNPVSEWGP